MHHLVAYDKRRAVLSRAKTCVLAAMVRTLSCQDVDGVTAAMLKHCSSPTFLTRLPSKNPGPWFISYAALFGDVLRVQPNLNFCEKFLKQVFGQVAQCSSWELRSAEENTDWIDTQAERFKVSCHKFKTITNAHPNVKWLTPFYAAAKYEPPPPIVVAAEVEESPKAVAKLDEESPEAVAKRDEMWNKYKVPKVFATAEPPIAVNAGDEDPLYIYIYICIYIYIYIYIHACMYTPVHNGAENIFRSVQRGRDQTSQPVPLRDLTSRRGGAI